jgi:flavin-dependent dehydrogenase
MKIVIVGGGTAGWIAALYISTIHSDIKVTLIESEDIGIIGAGEGSTSLLTGIISNKSFDFKCDELDFIKKTGATMKYGIRHKGWTPNLQQSYVGPIDGSMTGNHNVDATFLHAVAKLPIEEIHRASAAGFLIKNNKASFTKNLNDKVDAHAYHFDAHLVGKYFKEICLKNGVERIDDQVVEVNLSEAGNISSLNLKSGIKIEGDFFIDASGFKKILISKLGSKWISYRKHLPVNAALPFQIKYKENEIIEPTTLAWAQKNGWMWRIPVRERYGAGYVFSDEFTTPDKAQEEIEQALGHSIDPIRLIKFDAGRLDKCWNKNCLAIGLASAFLEPLEATSIHSTIVMINWFVSDFLRSTIDQTVNPSNELLYNNRCNKMFETFKDFLIMHYQGGRTDSEFWKYISSGETETEFVKALKESCKSRIPNSRDFDNFSGSAGWPLWSYVMAGTGVLTKEAAQAELNFYNLNEYSERIFTETEEYLENTFSHLIDNTDLIAMSRTPTSKGSL